MASLVTHFVRVKVRDCLGDAVEEDEGLARIEARQHSVAGGHAAVAVPAQVEQLLRISESNGVGYHLNTT